MKSRIAIASCLVVLGLAALIVWFYMMHAGQGGVTMSGTISKDIPGRSNSSGLGMNPASVRHVFDLPAQMAFLRDDEFSPGYFDLENKTLYRWKGVVLRGEQLKQTAYGGIPSGIKLQMAKNLSVVTVEAPVKYWYWEDGEGYRPGYLDRTIWTFYAWKDIVLSKQELLDKSPDGHDTVVKPAFPSQRIGVLEIDMPAHLKEHPELWKKGGAYTSEARIRAEKRAAEKKAAEKKALEERAREPRVFTLLVRVTSFGENEFSPCYYDPENKSLYRWKGVVLRLEQVPYAYIERKIVMLIPAGLAVEPVEAPVHYREVNEEYRPGYLDRSIGVFYEWKDIVLSKQELPDKSKDGQDAVVKSAAFSRVIEIDMPAYLKEKPNLWKKG